MLLYGSYARDDFREDSDIDIMILVDLDDPAIKAADRQLSDVTFEINFDHDAMIMPIVQNEALFDPLGRRISVLQPNQQRGDRTLCSMNSMIE